MTFGVAKPYPYGAFVGAQSPIIQKAQFADCLGANGAAPAPRPTSKPIGTGPFLVTDFKAERRGLAGGQPELPRPGQAGLRQRRRSRAAAMRRRRRARCSRPASSTMPGTRRSTPDDPGADGSGRQGRGHLRLRHAGRAASQINQTDPDPASARRAVDHRASASVPDRHPNVRRGAVASRSTARSWSRPATARPGGRPATWCRRRRCTPRRTTTGA